MNSVQLDAGQTDDNSEKQQEVMMSSERVEVGGLKVDLGLYELVRDEISPGTGVGADDFWNSLGQIVSDLEPNNRKLLDRRDELQQQIDGWHAERAGTGFSGEEARDFLAEIGYLVEDDGDLRSKRPMLIPRSPGSPAHNWSFPSTTPGIVSTPPMPVGGASTTPCMVPT